MGFCARCAEPLHSPRCLHCGLAAAATATASSPPPRDAWADSYLASRFAGTATTATATATATCFLCDTAIDPLAPPLLLRSDRVCPSCHAQYASRGSCAACGYAVINSERYIAHNNRLWHRGCFVCRVCRSQLEQPLVDLDGKPCCESCLMAQAGTSISTTAPAVSPKPLSISHPASPAIPPKPLSTNGRASPAIPPKPLSATGRSSPAIPPKPLSATGRASPAIPPKPLSNTGRSSPALPPKPVHRAVAQANSLRSTATATTSSSASSSSRKKRETFLCARCGDLIRDAGVRLPSGEIFHPACFTCHGCGQLFHESAFVSVGGNAYHPDCSPNKEKVIRCVACDKLVSGFYVKNSDRAYHPDCFCCASCQSVISPKAPFGEHQGRPYCEHCLQERRHLVAGTNTTPPQAISPPLSSPAPAPPAPSPPPQPEPSTSPPKPSASDAMPRVHPTAQQSLLAAKLGGTNTCFKCHAKVYKFEEAQGPKATRWHKKCLVCTTCKKQLDSAALMNGDEDGPYCRLCYVCRVATPHAHRHHHHRC